MERSINMRWEAIVALIGFGLLSGLAKAQIETETLPSRDGNPHFQSELNKFLSRDAALEIAGYERAAASADIDIVKSEMRPFLNVSGSAGYVEQVITSGSVLSDRSTDGSARLTVSQLLYDGGHTGHRKRVREAASLVADHTAEARYQQAISLAADSYFTLAASRRKIKIREAGINILERVGREAELKFEIGDGTRTQIGFSSARLASSYRDLSLERLTLDVAAETYRRAFGSLPVALSLDPPNCPQLPQTLEAFKRLAVEQNPEIRAAIAKEEEARAAVSAARSILGPRVSVEGGAVARRTDLGGFFERQSSVGLEARLNLNLPLSSGGRKAALTDKARQDYLTASVRRQDIHRQLSMQASLKWSGYQTLEDALGAAEDAVGFAELALEGATKERDAGLRSELDVLRAEELLLAAKVSHVDLRSRLSRARVNLITASHAFDCLGLSQEDSL